MWHKLPTGGVARRLAGGTVLTLGASALLVGVVPLGTTAGGRWLGTATASAGTVTVQRGQDLTQIARELHTTVAALAAANGLSDPNWVLAGQLLQVPSTGGPGRSGAGPRSVVVQPGQTLTSIAAHYGVTVAALAGANGLGDPNRVLAGSHLVVPSGTSAMALASFASPSGGGIPPDLAAHPQRLSLESDFASAGARYGVPVPLLEALCWWESGWQVSVVSLTGAVGVCQIEPATTGFANRYLTGAQLDPNVAAQNIDIGAAYLASLLRATGGDVAQAVAGYYQGLGSVRSHGMFPATAHYVKGILAYEAIFAG